MAYTRPLPRLVRPLTRSLAARAALTLTLALAGAVALPPASRAQEPGADATWKELRPDVFGERAIEETSPLVRLEAPGRAEDAAMVPVEAEVMLPAGDARTVKSLTLIVDENPAPVAATFTFGGARQEVMLGTRLRVNSYSYVRAVAELSDGSLHMRARYVKASGGCSAPAMKDEETALKNLGQVKMKVVKDVPTLGDPTQASRVSQIQLMIRHPNYSGLQLDQVTRGYIPAKFVDNIEVRQGDALVFRMVGGISLSEDPAIQVSYEPNGQEIDLRAADTDGLKFESAVKPAG